MNSPSINVHVEPEHENQDDFVSDTEIARRWRVSVRTASRALKMLDRLPGFPKRDPMFANKRYWPAVKFFLLKRYDKTLASDITKGVKPSPRIREDPIDERETGKNR
jgi:hypothetical protein